MIRKIISLLVLSAAAMSTAGCAWPFIERPWPTDEYTSERPSAVASTPSLTSPPLQPHRKDMASLIYLAAQTLADRAESLDKTHSIIVTTIVSVDDLNSSSTFGRLASELVANRIEQRGYVVRDVRYLHALEFDRKTGEFALSREASKLIEAIKANAANGKIEPQAVVAGTYAVGGEKIYLNLRLLSADKGELLSSADVVIPLDENTGPLVGAGANSVEEQLEAFDHFEERISGTVGDKSAAF